LRHHTNKFEINSKFFTSLKIWDSFWNVTSALLLSNRTIVSHLRRIVANCFFRRRRVSIFTYTTNTKASGWRKQSRNVFVSWANKRTNGEAETLIYQESGSAISLYSGRGIPRKDICIHARTCIAVYVYIENMEVGKPVLVSSCVASPARYTMPSRSLEKRWVD